MNSPRTNSDPPAVLDRDTVRDLMAAVLAAQGRRLPGSDDADLRDVGFRSLDFSELALRVEDELDRELNFDAPGLRAIRTVGDVLDFLTEIQTAGSEPAADRPPDDSPAGEPAARTGAAR